GPAAGGPRKARDPVSLVPVSDVDQQEDAEQRREREPGDARLAVRQHDEGREERTCGCAEVAADLEYRLRETVLATARHARDARGLRVKYRGAGTDQCGSDEQQLVARGVG